MPADWLSITTEFLDPATGIALTTGHLVATMLPDIVLASGGMVPGFRTRFAIDAGQAEQADGDKMLLPITEDSDPGNVPIYLELYDANGRLSNSWTIVVPRPLVEPYVAVDLETLI